MAKLLIGYDVECRWDKEITRHFMGKMLQVHGQLGAPCTLFVTGAVLERDAAAFQAASEVDWLDIQQHTYSHVLLKTVFMDNGEEVKVWPGASLDEIQEEVVKTNALFQQILGRPCIGITGPYAYYRGLGDRPDILQILREEGIRFTRTWGRNEKDWQPVPFDIQPFWYQAQGFPEMLEFPINGWQDCIWRERNGWDNREGYLEHLKSGIDTIAETDLIWSYVQHDWSSVREDPEMEITRRFLEYALEHDVEVATYTQVYEEMKSSRRDPCCG